MPVLLKKLFGFAGLWTLAALAHAQSAPTTAPAPAPVPTERSWRFGLAFGYGERTNPLIQSDDIPVLVDVDLAWFGKRWFFDNGDFGFVLVDRPLFTTNLVARVNTDRAFFANTNTKFVSFTYLGGGSISAQADPTVPPIEVKPPDRDYAIELGLETLFDGDWGSAALHAFHDVSGTHGGFEVAADYQYRVTTGRFSLAPSVGVAYKSAELNDYYWGVRADEANIALPEYHASSGFGWQAGLKANYYVTKSMRIALSVDYEQLQDTVAASPLVEEDHVLGYFTGVAWTF